MPKIDLYCSPYCGVADHIIGFIDRCTTTLDIAVYSITHDGISDAIVRAHERGVQIRVLTDKVQAAGRYADDEKLEKAGIPVRRDIRAGLMHCKFAVDGDLAVVKGSFNWTQNADEVNAEHWEINRYKYVLRWYRDYFEKLWEHNAPSS